LGGEHGTFVQFDEGNSVGGVGIVAAGGFVDGGVGIDFAFAAKCKLFFGFVAAVWADIARGEDLVIAVRANLADQPVALFLESPMSWDFHGYKVLSIIAFCKPNSIWQDYQRLSGLSLCGNVMGMRHRPSVGFRCGLRARLREENDSRSGPASS